MGCSKKKATGALDSKAPKAPKSPMNKPTKKNPDAMRGSIAKKKGK